MSLILNIDTSLSIASISLSNEGNLLGWDKNDNKDDNGWLHERIPVLLSDSGFTMKDLSAVATSIGPGSYTGLRIGLSAAKGLCFALDIPLIGINTLKMMAAAVADECEENMQICPMIDARRMEVFIATYDRSLHQIYPAAAIIPDAQFFERLCEQSRILFCGNGVEKLRPLITSTNAIFSDKIADARHLSILSCQDFVIKNFTDLAYSEPLYIKEFFSG